MALIVCPQAQVLARDKSTKSLKEKGLLKIPEKSCQQIEDRLGQLLYVNVDGYGAPKGSAITPAYIDMVKDLQIGGVLPHSGSPDLATQKKSFSELQKVSDLPLMIGVDNLIVGSEDDRWGATFGMGYGPGFLSRSGYENDACVSARSYLDAFLHRAVGLNHSLGPTIEQNSSHGFLANSADKVAPKVELTAKAFDDFGVATTMKHYPYTPSDYNLHAKTEDSRIPESQVNSMLDIFRRTSGKTDFAMSTHLYNSNVDPEDMATFSKKWVQMLRKDVGFDGILMTDALFMFKKYDATVMQMSSKWPQDQIPMDNVYTIFAARAILSGHDMVFLEGRADQTYAIFNNLMRIACDDKPVSRELRERILESHGRITKWKKKNAQPLKQSSQYPEELVKRATELYRGRRCPRPEEFAEFKQAVAEYKVTSIERSAQASRMSKTTNKPAGGADSLSGAGD